MIERIKPSSKWAEFFLPSQKVVRWTWKRWVLLAFGIVMLVDSFIVPFYGPVDPGGSGAGILFLILGFRAASRRKLPTSVVIAGGFAAALTWAMNQRLVKSPSVVWTSIGIILVLFVVFWGRGRRGEGDEVLHQESVEPDAHSMLDVTEKRSRS